jgi:trimethylamine---corrinoid protein Co-methyltransferase
MASRATMSVWDEAACARAHAASRSVLQRAGIEIGHPEGLALLGEAGARIEGGRAFISGSLIDEVLGSAPVAFDIPGRGRGGMRVEQGRSWFGTGPDCLYVHDPFTGARRRARLDDIVASADLCEKLDQVDFIMSMGLPENVPLVSEDLLQFAAMLDGTSKPLVVSTSHGGDGLTAMREMAGLCGDPTSFGCLIMSSPPLKFDHDAVDKLIVCARLGIPAILAPAPSAGATAPASVSSAIIVADAEVIAGLCVHQLARPGAPFVYGVGAAAMDMRVAVDAYVIPEHFLGNAAACDLARSYGIPSWAYAGPSDAKALDGQLAADVAITTLLGALSRATLLHDIGYMESGMAGAQEAIVLGAELVGFARAFLRELPLDDEALQLDEIVAVGPGGNHLARPYTRKHHRDFWTSDLFDHAAHDRWRAEGGTSLRERVRQRTRDLLCADRAHRLPEGVRREFDRIVSRVADSRLD